MIEPTKENIDIIRENVDLTIPGDVFRHFDVLDECMGNIVHFWKGTFEDFKPYPYALLGFPQDLGIRNMGGKTGVRDGPTGFRKAFYKLPNHFEKPENLLIDLGNIKFDIDATLEEIHVRMVRVVKILMDMDIFPIVIGGGNDVTYAAIKGLAESEKFKKLGLISFDAHLNLHNVPEKFISASTMFRIMEDFPKLISKRNIVYFGSRKETISPHYARQVLDNNIHIFYRDKITRMKQELLQGLNQANYGCDGLVVSFDMDVCDGGMMPGTSFPMPGGITSDEVIEIAKSLSKYKMAVYLDLVNLNPLVDNNDITSTTAALFVFHFLEKKEPRHE